MVISCEHYVQIVSNSRVGTATHCLKSNPATRFLLLFQSQVYPVLQNGCSCLQGGTDGWDGSSAARVIGIVSAFEDGSM